MPLKLTIAIAFAALVPIAAGCGEKEEPPTTGPVVTQTTTGQTTTQTTNPSDDLQVERREIEQTVRTFLTVPNDRSVCEDLITPNFLKRSYGNMSGCLASRKPSAMARSVSITFPPKQPPTVQAKPTGGVYAGQKLDIEVVFIEGQAMIDKLKSNAKVGP